MELSEAKDILECSDKDYFMETLYETYHQSNVKKFEEAIDTVLEALDNSISKDEVRKLREKYWPAIKHYDCDEADYSQSQKVGAYMALTRILGE